MDSKIKLSNLTFNNFYNLDEWYGYIIYIHVV